MPIPILLRARPGRLLVECLVAIVLVAVGGIALGAASRATALLADDAMLVSRVRLLAMGAADSLHVVACAAPPTAAGFALPRADLAVSPLAEAPRGPLGRALHHAGFTATLTVSPFSTRTPAALTLSSARSCGP